MEQEFDDSWRVVDLREEARLRGIKGANKARKDQLIEALNNGYNEIVFYTIRKYPNRVSTSQEYLGVQNSISQSHMGIRNLTEKNTHNSIRDSYTQWIIFFYKLSSLAQKSQDLLNIIFCKRLTGNFVTEHRGRNRKTI